MLILAAVIGLLAGLGFGYLMGCIIERFSSCTSRRRRPAMSTCDTGAPSTAETLVQQLAAPEECAFDDASYRALVAKAAERIDRIRYETGSDC